MFVLNIKLKNAKEVSEFKDILVRYDDKVSTIIGGQVVARPMITSSPYITPLDDIAIHYNGGTLNEFMQMVRELIRYIKDNQDPNTTTVINSVRRMIDEESGI